MRRRRWNGKRNGNGGAKMHNTKVICFANNKGGSGKSTTCSNVGYALSLHGKRVLLIDGDMQLNLSLSLFDEDQVLAFARSEKNLYEGIKKQADLAEFIVPSPFENLDLIPSSTLMSSIEYELFTKWQREYILKKCLSGIVSSRQYDYLLIDAPPTLGGWVMNILCASNEVVIPVESTPWGLFGLGNMFEFLKEVEQITPDLKLGGVVITRVDTRKSYFRQTLDVLRELDGVKVFDTYIRVDSSIEWSQDNHMPVMAYKKGCRSAREYEKLAEEIMRK